MPMERITKSRLALTLDNAIRTSVGIRGLNTLIYGWLNLRHYGPKYRNAIYNRDWLYVSEVQDLSDYAGYDLLTGRVQTVTSTPTLSDYAGYDLLTGQRLPDK